MNNLKKEILTTEPSEEIFNVLEDINYEMVNRGLHPNASELDKTKYQFCKDIARLKRENNLSDLEISKRLNVDKKRVLEIILCHIEKFTLEDLFNYSELLAKSLESKFVVYHSNNFIVNDGYYSSGSSNNKSYKL